MSTDAEEREEDPEINTDRVDFLCALLDRTMTTLAQATCVERRIALHKLWTYESKHMEMHHVPGDAARAVLAEANHPTEAELALAEMEHKVSASGGVA